METLVALALALVAVLALMQAEAGARSTRGVAEGQVAAVAAVRTALEARHPLIADPPTAVAAGAPDLSFAGVELAWHEASDLGGAVPATSPGSADAGTGTGTAANWSLRQHAVEARWRPAAARPRVWWLASLQWQAPADRLAWLDGRAILGSRVPGSPPWAAPGGGSGRSDGLDEPGAAGEPLDGDVDPAPAGAGTRAGLGGGSSPQPGQSPGRPVETVVAVPASPGGPRTAGLGPLRPAAAARLEAAIRQVRRPGTRGGLQPGWVLQSGALRVDPAVLADASRSRDLQDWIARVIEPDASRSEGSAAPQEADRPPVCELQPVAGLDPHLAWRCLGWAGTADLFLLPRTGLPVGWVVCRFRVQVPGGTVRVQAPAPRVHAWIGWGVQGCPAEAEPA